ncbi:response regulator transcription factor [Aquaspirillum serpens]|uniref:response regulator transcription factor n=1 Tax=Aquaspirillum serpens TaxID=190 RepID=UPI0003B3B9FB|nr:response regulator transcription factor [Aquaspirillum serpens]
MGLFDNHKIAWVEDEEILRKELVFQLRYLGFETEEFSDATQFYRSLCVQSFTAVILDIGLVGEDGLSIARHLRQHNKKIGIIFITARGLRENKMEGFDSGADYYFVKPVDIMEVSLAIRRIIERMYGESSLPESGTEVLVCGPWMLNEEMCHLAFAPKQDSMALSLAEMNFLKILFLAQGELIEHKDFLLEMALEEGEIGKHRLEVIVSRLRNKVRRQFGVDLPIQVRRGMGYYIPKA